MVGTRKLVPLQIVTSLDVSELKLRLERKGRWQQAERKMAPKITEPWQDVVGRREDDDDDDPRLRAPTPPTDGQPLDDEDRADLSPPPAVHFRIVYARRPPVDAPPGFAWVRRARSAGGGWYLGNDLGGVAPRPTRGQGGRRGRSRGGRSRGGRGGHGRVGRGGHIATEFGLNLRSTTGSGTTTDSGTRDSGTSS